MTSVAFSRTARPEPASPELALVDPDLAARLRALLPDPPDALAPRSPAIRPPAAVVTVPAVAPIAPEPIVEPRLPDGPAQAASNVHHLRPSLVEPAGPTPAIPPVKEVDREEALPQPKVETRSKLASETTGPASRAATSGEAASRWLAQGAGRTAAAAAPLAAFLRESAASHRRVLGAFAAGAVVASFVVVGVIAALGESSGEPVVVADGAPSLVPPAVAAPVPRPVAPSSSTTGAKKPAGSGNGKTVASAKKKTTAATPKKPPAASKTAAARKKTTAAAKKKPATAPAAAPARRFAWAPVDGAVGYRVELFRGNEQVLRATTKQPVYELPGSWRHEGQAEHLSPGSYRWYVWPVRSSGPAAEAVVQARLDVP